MRTKGLRIPFTFFAVTLLVTTTWAATHEKVLYNFGPTTDYGVYPVGGLIFDGSGALYGTTSAGTHLGNCPADGCGTVFKLTRKACGRWEEKELWAFDVSDGVLPEASLIFDASGNLYSTTYEGGAYQTSTGVVFELTPEGQGAWTETVIHNFPSSRDDGTLPEASLIFDSSGNLYGTASAANLGCGAGACGVVFELIPRASKGWTEKVVHIFKRDGKDGFEPHANLILDASGNLYGTTEGGPEAGCNEPYGWCGTVFELMPKAAGCWSEKILHRFNGKDGATPTSGLIADKYSNLYGTTYSGGDGKCNNGGFTGCGTVFELSPKAGGGWTEKVLYSFHGKDGAYPEAGLMLDSSGILYGTTANGGSGQCDFQEGPGCGTVFALTPKADGSWTEKVLHSFQNNGKDGILPFAGVILDRAGNIYGTTVAGGTGKCDGVGCGTVFEITP